MGEVERSEGEGDLINDNALKILCTLNELLLFGPPLPHSLRSFDLAHRGVEFAIDPLSVASLLSLPRVS